MPHDTIGPIVQQDGPRGGAAKRAREDARSSRLRNGAQLLAKRKSAIAPRHIARSRRLRNTQALGAPALRSTQ